MAIRMVSDKSFDNMVIKNHTTPVLVTFWAPKWSSPCRLMTPTLNQLASEMDGRLEVLCMDIDESPETPMKFGVRGIPTHVIFGDGRAIGTKVGSMPKSILSEWISTLLVDEHVLGIMLEGNKLRAVSLLRDGTYRFLDGANGTHSLLFRLSEEYLRLTNASHDLEMMINGSGLKERHFQEFFEEYPEFVLDTDHAVAHPHLVLERTLDRDLIPDFILEPYSDNSLCDLLELKMPQSPVFRRSGIHGGFSHHVTRAIDQLFNYRDYFDDQKNRQATLDAYGLTAFRPRLFLIIGRRQSLDSFELRKSQDKLNGVFLRTYDDVLDRMKNRLLRQRSR